MKNEWFRIIPSKGHGRVYRFTDGGTSVSNFQTFVGGRSYTINYGSGSLSESWGLGNDNLTFDGDGNLFVLQDGGRGHLWMVKPTHTQASPQVELFATTPTGSEPTGMTLTPDFKFMFLSFQHPSSTNGTQVDASGASVAFNAASTVVIGRKGTLGKSTARFSSEEEVELDVEIDNTIKFPPNPAKENIKISFVLNESSDLSIKIYDISGKELSSVAEGQFNAGRKEFNLNVGAFKRSGEALIIKVMINGKGHSKTIILE